MDIDTTSINTNTVKTESNISTDSNKPLETGGNIKTQTTDSVNISQAAFDRLRVDTTNKSNETEASNETRETELTLSRKQVDDLTFSIRENPELALTAQSSPSSLPTAQNLIS